MDDFPEFNDAPGWGLLLWGLAVLPFALGLGMLDVLQGAAVRSCCEAMKAGRGQQ